MNDLEKKIEFVRNAVIMANNSDCKTLEEALEKELKNPNCLFLDLEDDKISSVEIFNLKLKIAENFAKDMSQDIKDLMFNDKILNIKFHEAEVEALGLPITLERLLIALNTINKEEMYISDGNDIMILCGDLKIICKYDLINEQTISKLAEIFGYSEEVKEKNK